MISGARNNRPARLGLAEWGLLAEALVTLAAASAAIRAIPFRRVAAAAARWGRAATRHDPETVRRTRWAVEAWSRRVPWRTVCFQKGLTLHLMLRRRGIESVLLYGVAQQPERGLAAHVWVDVGEESVIGGEEAAGFTCLARFPGEA
jgi:hypothetical protein